MSEHYSLLVDKRWANNLSPLLEGFSWTGPEVAQFRCPICGDSQKNKRKKRGNFYKDSRDQELKFKCHNCGAAHKFRTFLKRQFPHMFRDYRLDMFRETGQSTPEAKPVKKEEPKVRPVKLPKTGLFTKISDLPNNHIAVEFCRKRQLPNSALSKLGYAEDFAVWVHNSLGVTKYKTPNKDSYRLPRDERLLIPLTYTSGKIFGVQGRVLKGNLQRYITIKKDDMLPKVYGVSELDLSKPIIGVEGPIDSLFLSNAIAFCGGDVNVPLKVDPQDVYILLDNEPRSPDTVKRMKKAIEQGFNLCFWNIDSRLCKDINEAILKGYSASYLENMIFTSALRGVRASMKLNSWKKC